MDLFRQLLAEFLGAFAIVFAGTGAVIVNIQTGGAISHAGIALTFGLVVLSMIYALGEVSGANFNPAVTLAFAVAKRFPFKKLLPYVGSQFAGALAASFLLRFLFPNSPTMGQTLPSGGPLQSFVFEVILTFFLMLVILRVSTGAKEKGITAAIAIGAVVGLEAMFAGPVCGASMNPARSLAPALASGHLEHLWVYMIAPCLGAILAVPTAHFLSASTNAPQ
ncbi:MAG: aquaporin [Verrucomicrobiota bacterium]